LCMRPPEASPNFWFGWCRRSVPDGMEVQVYSTIPLTRTSASTKGARIRPPDPVAKEARGALPPVHSSSTLYTGAFSAFQHVVFLLTILSLTQKKKKEKLPVSHYATRDYLPAPTPPSDDPSKTSLSVPPRTQTQQSRSTVPTPPTTTRDQPNSYAFTPVLINPKQKQKKKKLQQRNRNEHHIGGSIDRSV